MILSAKTENILFDPVLLRHTIIYAAVLHAPMNMHTYMQKRAIPSTPFADRGGSALTHAASLVPIDFAVPEIAAARIVILRLFIFPRFTKLGSSTLAG